MVVSVPPSVLRRIRCKLSLHVWVNQPGGRKACWYCPTEAARLRSEDYWLERVDSIEDAREQAVRETTYGILEQRRARQNRAAFFSRS